MLAERSQWAHWLPVLLGIGIAGYFALPIEPPLWLGTVGVVCGLLMLTVTGGDVSKLVVMTLMTLSLGVACAQWRTYAVQAPIIQKRMGPVRIDGVLEHLERSENGGKLVLSDIVSTKISAAAMPAKIRLSIKGKAQPLDGLLPGDRVSVLAVLRPPPPPTMPGAFDFQRHAYFKGIGAYGFILGDIKIISPNKVLPTLTLALIRRIETIRLKISERVHALQNTDSGAVAAALLTGHRSYIPETILQNMRDAGIAHLLAISGLHIGLVAGIVFSVVRLLLVMVPAVGLRLDGKKTAAMLAIPAAFTYAVLAGLTVPTERAFLMTGLMLAGVLIDRRAISLRSVCWAAIVILLIRPESLVGPGFQMSFAAVTALIAVYGWLSRRRMSRQKGSSKRGLFGHFMRYLGSVLVTTIIASAATAPFAVYHFQHVAAFGLIANAIAVPLAAFWVMPAGVATLLAAPFGLESGPLWMMCTGIDWILACAATVAKWPGAAVDIAAPPVWSLALTTCAGLWLCLWQTRWRYGAVPVLIFGLTGPLFTSLPDLIIDGDARTIAVSDQVAGLLVSTSRSARFETKNWQSRLGYARQPVTWVRSAETRQGRLRCDANGCTFNVAGRLIAISLDEQTLQDDCQLSDMLISMVPVRARCKPSWGVIDRFDLWRGGTHTIRFSPEGPQIQTVNGERGHRPWVIAPDN